MRAVPSITARARHKIEQVMGVRGWECFFVLTLTPLAVLSYIVLLTLAFPE